MALRAVIFDFGMVLSGERNPEANAELLRLTGLKEERFESLYWAERPAYDAGKLCGLEYWRRFVREAGLGERFDEDGIAQLNRLDGRMWTTSNPKMIAWQQRLAEKGLKTAILSNIGDGVTASLLANFDWLNRFDLLIWSYQLRLIKPEPEIYQQTLQRLGCQPSEALFIDDREDNVAAARRLGLHAFVFTTAEQLTADLAASPLAAELPLPA